MWVWGFLGKKKIESHSEARKTEEESPGIRPFSQARKAPGIPDHLTYQRGGDRAFVGLGKKGRERGSASGFVETTISGVLSGQEKASPELGKEKAGRGAID